MAEMQQVQVAKKLINPIHVDGPYEVRYARCIDAPLGGSKGKQVDSYIKAKS